MELTIAVLLGLWISISGIVALRWIKKEFKNSEKQTRNEDRP